MSQDRGVEDDAIQSIASLRSKFENLGGSSKQQEVERAPLRRPLRSTVSGGLLSADLKSTDEEGKVAAGSSGSRPTSPRPSSEAAPAASLEPPPSVQQPDGSSLEPSPAKRRPPPAVPPKVLTTATPKDSDGAGPSSASPAAEPSSAPSSTLKSKPPPPPKSRSADRPPQEEPSPEPKSSAMFLTPENMSRASTPGPSRSSSPKPPLNRSSKPPPRPVDPPTPQRVPSPMPIDIAPSPNPPRSAPPQLPVRKQTLPVPDPGPPPLPGNKPSDSPVPPRLPSRPRGDTLTPEPLSSTPPRLPARNATIPAPPSSALSTSPASMRDESYIPPPPPTRASVSSGSGDSLPPPVRATSIRSTRSAEARAKVGPLIDYRDDSEEELEESEATPLTAGAKRMLEETPDSTHANRRPPKFVPDVKLWGTSNIFSFAVFGRHVAVGFHNVAVYDTFMSERPVFTIDLKETGLDFRVKEPRVTAMCFRPAYCPADEGRYLWCGTKDGHLWELDIKTGKVTDTRAFAHGAAVTHIFRYKTWLLSLDEHGKGHVFEVAQLENGAAPDASKIPELCKTIRVPEKFNFVKLINGRLWTSSGPADRSTTTKGAKGPTIRVYEPCTAGAMPPPTTILTSEWTGATTAATVMPFHPDKVYLSHEGGFVSIWDAKELACLQVLKISATDVLSLEGAGKALWAGNRKGQIHVYDIESKPWQVTNLWTASEHGVHTLMADPRSIEHAGRFTLWSYARDGLRAWDGLRSVDWMDQKMTLREPAYCDFREIKILVCTWNIDSARPEALFGSDANINFFDDLLNSVDSPDIIVFGLQEVIPLTDKKLTAKTILFGSGKNKEADSDKIWHAYRQWKDRFTSALRMCLPETPYILAHSDSLVGLLSCIFVKASERDRMRDVDICTVKRGIGNLYGNKGAIVARMVMDDTSLCFINVHLAAGQSQKASRNADLAAIMEDKAILPPADVLPYVHGGDGTAILDHELVVLNGDLNYRIDQRRENVISNVAAEDYSFLLENDQLRKEMKNNHAFRLRNFEEAPIWFAPTYKYNTGTSEYDSSEKKRIPAWCDRILFKKSERISSTHYRRYEPTISDHRPVSAGFTAKIKAVDAARASEVRAKLSTEWAKEESELLEKMTQAYAQWL